MIIISLSLMMMSARRGLFAEPSPPSRVSRNREGTFGSFASASSEDERGVSKGSPLETTAQLPPTKSKKHCTASVIRRDNTSKICLRVETPISALKKKKKKPGTKRCRFFEGRTKILRTEMPTNASHYLKHSRQTSLEGSSSRGVGQRRPGRLSTGRETGFLTETLRLLKNLQRKTKNLRFLGSFAKLFLRNE
ncbi:unnamed protein product [Ixodes pacificus]